MPAGLFYNRNTSIVHLVLERKREREKIIITSCVKYYLEATNEYHTSWYFSFPSLWLSHIFSLPFSSSHRPHPFPHAPFPSIFTLWPFTFHTTPPSYSLTPSPPIFPTPYSPPPSSLHPRVTSQTNPRGHDRPSASSLGSSTTPFRFVLFFPRSPERSLAASSDVMTRQGKSCLYICPTCLCNPPFHCIVWIPPISVSLSVHFCPTLFLSFILHSTQQCVTMSVPVCGCPLSLSISLHSLSVAYSSICFPLCPSIAWILKFLSLFPYGASLCLTSETIFMCICFGNEAQCI